MESKKTIIIYRFKTKKEFIKDKRWSYDAPTGWSENMRLKFLNFSFKEEDIIFKGPFSIDKDSFFIKGFSYCFNFKHDVVLINKEYFLKENNIINFLHNLEIYENNV